MESKKYFLAVPVLLIAAAASAGCRYTVANIHVDESNKLIVSKAKDAVDEEVPAVEETENGGQIFRVDNEEYDIMVSSRIKQVKETGTSWGIPQSQPGTEMYEAPATLSLDSKSILTIEDRKGNKHNYPANNVSDITIRYGFRSDNPDSETDETERATEYLVGTGVESAFGLGLFSGIPMPVTIGFSADIGKRLRLISNVGYHVLADTGYGTVGAGVVFRPGGYKVSPRYSFQLKIPIVGEIGFLRGSPEVGDGFNDGLKLLILGPITSLDFIWWNERKRGFFMSLRAGYRFCVRLNSADEYYDNPDRIGYPHVSMLFGMAF